MPVFLLVSSCCFADSVSIQLANGTDKEQQAKEQLERLFSEYDTSHYTFTRKVVIEQGVIPHSHPVLTLNVRYLQDRRPRPLHLRARTDSLVPDGTPAPDSRRQTSIGADVRESACRREGGFPRPRFRLYHLIVCELEREADLKLIGPERTDAVMRFWTTDHYTWIYTTVLADHEKIQSVIRKNNLEIK